jgi:hypothetical protein
MSFTLSLRILIEEFIKENADSFWLHQNEMWEYIEDEEI